MQSKWNSRRLAIAASSVVTLVGAAMQDGNVTENEFLGILAAIVTAIAAFAYVDKADKEKK